MIKKLYIWNDLNIFNLYLDENKLQNILTKNFNQIEFIKSDEIICWKESLNIKYNYSIALGSRPNILFPNIMNLKLSRIRNDKGETIGFKNNCLDELNKYLTYHIVYFYEDIIVEGTTIQYILKYFQKKKYQGILYFYVFCANKFATDYIKNKFTDLKIIFSIHKYMDGKPIYNSTLLCLYDLYFNKLGNTLYIDREDLYNAYLSDHASYFIKILKDNIPIKI